MKSISDGLKTSAALGYKYSSTSSPLQPIRFTQVAMTENGFGHLPLTKPTSPTEGVVDQYVLCYIAQ